MNKTERRNLLQSLCTESTSPKTAQPYQITLNDGLYECATDGRTLLGIKVKSSDLLPFPMKSSEEAVKFDEYFQAQANAKIDGAKLVSFLKMDDCAKCPLCSGSGKRLSIKPLDYDDYGDVMQTDTYNNIRHVTIGGTSIDGNRLALALVGLVVPEVLDVFIPMPESDNKKARPFIFHAENWHLVIMGLAPDQCRGNKFEVFEGVL